MRGFLIAAMLALAGCAPVAATVVLSEVAMAGCAAQAAANLAGAVARRQGNVAWSENFAEASKIAGVACAW